MLTERVKARIRQAVREMLKELGIDPGELQDMPVELETATRSAGKE